jgi:hypothetical protein
MYDLASRTMCIYCSTDALCHNGLHPEGHKIPYSVRQHLAENKKSPSRHADKRGLRNSLGCSKRETRAHRFCIYDGGNARLGLACAILANLSISLPGFSARLRL